MKQALGKPTARISKDEFLCFMFQDRDDFRRLGERTYEALMDKGSASISLNHLWEETWFIHADIIKNLNDLPAELKDGRWVGQFIVDDNNEVQECDADAIATMPCIGVSINTADVSADADCPVLMLNLLQKID